MFFFCFLSNQENEHIHNDLELFYDIYNTLSDHYWRQTHYLSLILNHFAICYLFMLFKWIKTFFHNFTASSLNIISMLSLFEYITWSSSLSMEKINLFVIVNWIFHVSDFLRLLIMSFKYGLILTYSSTESVLFLSRYFHVQYNCYSKNYSLLLVLKIFFLLKNILNISKHP